MGREIEMAERDWHLFNQIKRVVITTVANQIAGDVRAAAVANHSEGLQGHRCLLVHLIAAPLIVDGFA